MSKCKVQEILFNDLIMKFNTENGKYLCLTKKESNDTKKTNKLYSMVSFRDSNRMSMQEIEQQVKSSEIVNIVINISSKCNLNCKYCFRDSDKDAELSMDKIKLFVKKIITRFPYTKHFHIDLTGSGEPLLRMDLIKNILNFTKELRNEKYTINIGFCTNGTLLSKDTISFLEENEIYYGVSIDGNRITHDKYRTDYKGQPTFKKIIKNVKNTNFEYVGAAVTVTSDNYNLVENLKNLHKYFNVVTMKPVRTVETMNGEINEKNVENLIAAYNELYNFLLTETLKLNTWFIVKLIKGEDLFGRYIKRVFINQIVRTRCDAGMSRFVLDNDSRIYVCGAASKNPNFMIGNLEDGLYENKVDQIGKSQIESDYCKNCFAKSVCGGICMVYEWELRKFNKIDNRALCKLKQHLVLLALSFKKNIFIRHKNIFFKLRGICQDVHNV